ncbi:LPXTG cell wall anchor domain-containing protein [Glycomyces albidus]|uniref:LPXTG cell wall anchor domain-containing protein n=1 Tax=Glycomyces albidus TaxID=2656774 RepID=A0A6L5G7S1_9ACTN|nr:LPXTG cell wall anchor domain-containing protein [Glycomyces albidus]MQM25702.1 LPXTG cell wall anchor domain-containing protein [Glycomyces albidus]
MSTLNKTGLRLAAAGAAAAIALAAGAPAFAQEETPSDEATTPAETESTETEATEEETETEDENAGDDTEVEDEKDPAADDEVPEQEVPEGELPAENEDDEDEGWEHVYSYQYLDQLLQGANEGESVLAQPEFYVEEAAANPELTAATVLVFTDSMSFSDLLEDGSWNLTHHAYAAPMYDNCTIWEWGATCIVTDFEAEAGKTYTPSEATPLYYDIVGEVDEDDAAAYYAVDVDAAGLEEALAEGFYDLESDNQFELVETEGSEGDWFFDFGLFYFEADLVLPDVPTADEPGLPVTGNSSIIMVSSAAAALLAGAVVFFMLRRRKAAQHWE